MISLPLDIALTAIAAFLRTGAVLMVLPVFGDMPAPVMLRVILALALTAVVLPTVAGTYGVLPTDLNSLAVALIILKEITIGLVLGFIARATLAGILLAASIAAYQMGFGVASLFLPEMDTQADSFTALHRVLIMLLFLGLSLHHVFIGGLVESFRSIPIGRAWIGEDMATLLIETTASVFSIGLQLAAPILVSSLFTMSALGLIARSVPQLNVFTISFPLSFFVGLLVYIATIPFFPQWMQDRFLALQETVNTTLRTLGS